MSIFSGNAITGVFTKYVVAFADASLNVSNDLLKADVCIDADVTVRMSRGTVGANFEIVVYDLPEPKVKAINDALKDGEAKPHVTISLGYFDTSTALVMEGIYESVTSAAASDKLVTTIRGREAATLALATTEYTAAISASASFSDAVTNILAHAPFPAKSVTQTPQFFNMPSGTLGDPHFRSKKVLGILDEIAQRSKTELLVGDGSVYLGVPITLDDYAPAAFDPGTNLASFQPFSKKIPADNQLNFPTAIPAAQIVGFKFTVVGDPKMRPGQKVTLSNVKDYAGAANPEFRIRQLEHRFSATSGYICVGVAAQRMPDAASAQKLDAMAERSAASVANSLASRINGSTASAPTIEVCSVKVADPAYQADLYYGQPADGDETQPSINVAVEKNKNDDNVYTSKPIAAPFAWRKCGLVTPVYAGMKALVAHNRASASDGIVTGYLWSKTPDLAPPANQQGDWWLCLPIDFDITQPPKDSDKAVNDLTANDGRRVIELKGLKITVGSKALETVGTRPTLGDAEVCTIAHASGATITIKDGEIDVTDGASTPATIKLTGGQITLQSGSSGPKVTVSSSAVSLSDGALTVNLSGGQLAIG